MEANDPNQVSIRQVDTLDASRFLKLCQQLDLETKYMLLEPGERTTSVKEQERRIRSIKKQRNQVIFVAERGANLVGYVAGLGGSYRRNQHKADVVIGILQEYANAGLGTRLLERLEDWARAIGLHKLELTVMAHNQRAIHLYKKMGYEVEGISADSLWVENRFVDELDMAKIL
jgi:RimJ/RimL family protein N-acetyltransferase